MRSRSCDALRGSFAAYRALDATIAQNQQRTSRRLSLPVLAIGGTDGYGEVTANTMKTSSSSRRSRPWHRAEMMATSRGRSDDQPGVELYALHDGRDRLVMIESTSRSRRDRSTASTQPLPTCSPLWGASSDAILELMAYPPSEVKLASPQYPASAEFA